MFENLRILYLLHGGLESLIKSGYAWAALILWAISHGAVNNDAWADLALSLFPSITGFSIASFAIIFAVLKPTEIKVLLPPNRSGRSPLLIVAASIVHTVVIQVAALIIATSKKLSGALISDPESSLLSCCKGLDGLLNGISLAFSHIGLFLTYYGLFLVVGAILSVFRMLKIVSDTRKD